MIYVAGVVAIVWMVSIYQSCIIEIERMFK